MQAWSFASSVFDARQARRLFGVIGAGASAGAIVGGLLARELARRIGTVNLLLVLAVLIFLAAAGGRTWPGPSASGRRPGAPAGRCGCRAAIRRSSGGRAI